MARERDHATQDKFATAAINEVISNSFKSQEDNQPVSGRLQNRRSRASILRRWLGVYSMAGERGKDLEMSLPDTALE